MGKEQEKLLNPEEIIGREFRVPAIVGKGSGEGFEFSNLHLPCGWQKAIPELKKISLESFRNYFAFLCKHEGLIPGEIKVDVNTGILTKITIETEPFSCLYLSEMFFEKENGIYRAENLNSLRSAIVLQELIGKFLNRLGQVIGLENDYAVITGGTGAYRSYGLKIPQEFLNQKNPLTNEYFQRKFEVQASNIAGRFGLTLKWQMISFDERGIPYCFEVQEGNACGYYLDNQGAYQPHNVDNPYQAATLHGIAASFINELLRRKDKEHY